MANAIKAKRRARRRARFAKIEAQQKKDGVKPGSKTAKNHLALVEWDRQQRRVKRSHARASRAKKYTALTAAGTIALLLGIPMLKAENRQSVREGIELGRRNHENLMRALGH